MFMRTDSSFYVVSELVVEQDVACTFLGVTDCLAQRFPNGDHGRRLKDGDGLFTAINADLGTGRKLVKQTRQVAGGFGFGDVEDRHAARILRLPRGWEAIVAKL